MINVIRVVLGLLLAATLVALWFYPIITLLIIYPLSWVLLWDQLRPIIEYRGSMVDNVLKDEIIRPPWTQVFWNIVTAPILLVFLVIFFIVRGGFPIM